MLTTLKALCIFKLASARNVQCYMMDNQHNPCLKSACTTSDCACSPYAQLFLCWNGGCCGYSVLSSTRRPVYSSQMVVAAGCTPEGEPHETPAVFIFDC